MKWNFKRGGLNVAGHKSYIKLQIRNWNILVWKFEKKIEDPENYSNILKGTNKI